MKYLHISHYHPPQKSSKLALPGFPLFIFPLPFCQIILIFQDFFYPRHLPITSSTNTPPVGTSSVLPSSHANHQQHQHTTSWYIKFYEKILFLNYNKLQEDTFVKKMISLMKEKQNNLCLLFIHPTCEAQNKIYYHYLYI